VRPERRRRRLGALTGLLVLVLGAGTVRAEEPGPLDDEALVARRIRQLLDGLEDGSAGEESLVQSLVAAGPRILPAAFVVLTEPAIWRDERRRGACPRVAP